MPDRPKLKRWLTGPVAKRPFSPATALLLSSSWGEYRKPPRAVPLSSLTYSEEYSPFSRVCLAPAPAYSIQLSFRSYSALTMP
ncbi:hypothetical protein D3C76_1447350 [compost metagenome]